MIDYIGKLRLFDNSIVVVMTDHGSSLGEVPGELAYGVYTYDYSIKTWCYILSNNLNNNVNVGKAVRNVDILPTLLDLLKIKPKYDMDGESLLPLHKIQDRTAFVETAALIGPHPSPEKPNIKCIRTNEWKLIFNLTTEKKELYNLLKDPNEHNNLIGKHDEIEQDLMEQLSEYL